MESHQDQAWFWSLPQLLGELENIISLESNRNGNPWIKVSRLRELFYEKHGQSLDDLLQEQGYSYGLRAFLRSSRRFAIYGNLVSTEFYIGLRDAIFPYYFPVSTLPIQYRSRRSGNLDGDLLRILEMENAENIYYEGHSRNAHTRQSPQMPPYNPILPEEIGAVGYLELSLKEIVKSLAINHPETIVTVAILSQKFREHYGQPIRTIVRRVCPNLKLIDLLNNCSNIQVIQLDNDLQITWKIDS